MAERSEATPGTAFVGPLYIVDEEGNVLTEIPSDLADVLADFENRISALELAGP